MVTKRKTIKDLASEIEVLVKRLETMENIIEDLQNVQTPNIEKTVEKDSPGPVIEINVEKNLNSCRNGENVFKCKKCDLRFIKKCELKKHIRTIHPKNLKCEHCEKTFDQNCDLENHLKTHEQAKRFKCNGCDKLFLLKWRLMQHAKIHEDLNVKFCHFFNNDKSCPYEEIGCMFKHEPSPQCKFKENCLYKLCPSKHDQFQSIYTCDQCDYQSKKENDLKVHMQDHNNKTNQRSHETDNDESSDNDSDWEEAEEHYDIDEQIEEFDFHPFRCQKCTIILENHDKLIEHVETLHVKEQGILRDHLLPEKCENCPEWIYRSGDMENHYDEQLKAICL